MREVLCLVRDLGVFAPLRETVSSFRRFLHTLCRHGLHDCPDGLNAHTTGVQQEMCVKIGPRVGGCELRFFAIPET